MIFNQDFIGDQVDHNDLRRKMMHKQTTRILTGSFGKAFPNKGADRRKMTRELQRLIFMLCIGAALLCSTMRAQTIGTGAIQGTVQDPQGAVVPNATVTALDPATGRTTTSLTSATGSYLLPALQPATYKVTVKAAGFETLVQEKVAVTAFATVSLDLGLKLGAASQTVTVSSIPPQLDTVNGTLETTMPSEMYSVFRSP